MTPAQLDHLRRIDAHLANLLATAEKRTPGEWIHYLDLGTVGGVTTADGDATAQTQERVEIAQMADLSGNWRCKMAEIRNHNAAFIASCAGNAEAGWKATRAAIANWLSLYNSTEGYADGAPDASAHDKLCNEVASICRINLQHVIAAFPNI